MTESVDDVLEPEVSYIFRSNAQVEVFEVRHLSQSLTKGLCPVILDIVEIKIESESGEVGVVDFDETFAYAGSSVFSDVIKIEVKIEFFQICLGFYGFSYDVCSLSS